MKILQAIRDPQVFGLRSYESAIRIQHTNRDPRSTIYDS
jgi:hypothetical protein